VKRRDALAALALLGLAPRVYAQSDASQAQIDLALASASLAALLTRYGEAYPDVVAARARIALLSQTLTAARARHEVIDVARVTRALDTELADVRTRLSEFGTRCGGGHPDMQTARAREAALADALAHVTSDGFFVPG
jgi:hypothetical protein